MIRKHVATGDLRALQTDGVAVGTQLQVVANVNGRDDDAQFGDELPPDTRDAVQEFPRPGGCPPG